VSQNRAAVQAVRQIEQPVARSLSPMKSVSWACHLLPSRYVTSPMEYRSWKVRVAPAMAPSREPRMDCLAALWPQIEMAQPARASASAMPSPIPLLPPVMIATRPVRSKSSTDVPSHFQSLRAQRSQAFGCAQRRGSRPRIRSKPCFIAAKRSSISGSNSLSVKM